MSASPPELSRIWEYFSIRQAQTIKVHHNQRLSGGGKRCKSGNQKAYSERGTREFENTDGIRCQLARSSNPRVSAGQVLARFLGCELLRVPVLGIRKLSYPPYGKIECRVEIIGFIVFCIRARGRKIAMSECNPVIQSNVFTSCKRDGKSHCLLVFDASHSIGLLCNSETWAKWTFDEEKKKEKFYSILLKEDC